MSLNVSKLEQVRELPGGIVQARCPACAEGGHDRTGVHLRIYPDGRFGCCVHPKDGEHRKRIFALVGDRRPRGFTLRLNTPPALTANQSVKAALTAFNSGTRGTAKTESENGVPGVPRSLRTATMPTVTDFGTLGTPISNPRAYAREGSPSISTHAHTCKGLECAVPSVPSVPGSLEGGVNQPPSAAAGRLPFLTADGTLSIPFDSPERYHWWKPDGERLTVAETLAEVRAGLATKEKMNHAVTF